MTPPVPAIAGTDHSLGVRGCAVDSTMSGQHQDVPLTSS